jgi:hypothetical protein
MNPVGPYKFEGTFRNLILTGTYTASNPSQLDRGTFALMLANNGRTLLGATSYYVDGGYEVRSVPYRWERA